MPVPQKVAVADFESISFTNSLHFDRSPIKVNNHICINLCITFKFMCW